MVNSLTELFGPEGPLARSLEGYAPRPEQAAMAEHVSAAMEARETLIVEAGTGTGKTFAYLVPALLSGRRVILSTGTRALQDQLYHRDLPAICGALGRPARVALLKGRANYLCRHRLDLVEQQAQARGVRREVALALPKVRAWSYQTRRGDVAEPIEATRAALASDGDLLTTGEREAIEGRLADVSRSMATGELETVRRATEALVAGTDDFAARRMDRSIRAALAGRSVAELAK